MEALWKPFEGRHISSGMTAFAVFVAVVAIATRLLRLKKDPREPPFISSKIPVIGHLIGMITGGADYYGKLDKQYHRDIYSLRILNGRVYVVTTPEWTSAVQKNHRTLVFNSIMIKAVEKMVLFDQDAMTKMLKNINAEEGKWGVLPETHDMLYSILAPGPDLDALNLSVLRELSPPINVLNPRGETVKLWSWVRHNFSIASTVSLYGPENIFAVHPELEDDFWTFESELVSLMAYPMPSITSRKAHLARQRLLNAMIDYVKAKRYEKAAQIIKNRIEINRRNGFSWEMCAHAELSMLFGALVNSAPACFWLLAFIFGDSSLLSEIRREVDQCLSGTGSKRSINATRLKTECPLFVSTFREMLRVTGNVNSNRYVLENTTVTLPSTGRSYVLKKGGFIQIASSVIHSNPSVWGSNVDQFNPQRFLPANAERVATKDVVKSDLHKDEGDRDAEMGPQKKIHPSAFRAFGGGATLCPGRHFAQTEIMAFVALFIAGFDLQKSEAGGAFQAPPRDVTKLPLGVQKPQVDVDVWVAKRKGVEDVEWTFEM